MSSSGHRGCDYQWDLVLDENLSFSLTQYERGAPLVIALG
jgi:hypothetical protein